MPASLIPSEPSSWTARIRPLVAQTFDTSSIATSVISALGADAAVLLVEHQPEEPVLAEELDHVPRKLGGGVDLGRPRPDPLAGERPDELADLPLLRAQSVARHAPSLDSANVILENGLIRTLDPQIPTQRALAIAGEWIAGGVGVHETALATPDVVDLRGRVVLPGLNDAHVHFPSWALAQGQVSLDGCASLDEALGRIRGAQRAARARRCAGTAGGAATGAAREPTKEHLDAVVRDVPAAMVAKDHHSLWLNSAALALADGDLEVEGGVVERDARGEPTGVLREEAAWRFQERHLPPSDDEYLDAMRRGLKLAAPRGVTAVHDKDGGLGALSLWQRLEAEGALHAARVAVGAARPPRAAAGARHPLRLRQPSRCGSAT